MILFQLEKLLFQLKIISHDRIFVPIACSYMRTSICIDEAIDSIPVSVLHCLCKAPRGKRISAKTMDPSSEAFNW